jgi:hypothetical protein
MVRNENSVSFLRGVDSPTIANAIEHLQVRDRCDGYIGGSVRCLFPELGVMVGYALTVTVDSQPGPVADRDGHWRMWEALLAFAMSRTVTFVATRSSFALQAYRHHADAHPPAQCVRADGEAASGRVGVVPPDRIVELEDATVGIVGFIRGRAAAARQPVPETLPLTEASN